MPIVSPVVTPPVCLCHLDQHIRLLAAGEGAEAPVLWVGQLQVRQAALVIPSGLVGGLSYQLTSEGDIVQWRQDGWKGRWRQVIKPLAGAFPSGH